MPTPRSRWSVAKVTSIASRVAAASGPSAAMYRRASSGTANGQRTRPSAWTSAAAEPTTIEATVSGAGAPEGDRQQRHQRQHGQGAQEERLPAQDQARAPAAKRRRISSGSLRRMFG